MRSNKPCLAITYVNVAFRYLCAPGTQALDLPAFEHESGLESRLDEIVVPRLAIGGDDVFCGLFGLLAAHWRKVWIFEAGRDYKVMLLSGRGICMRIAASSVLRDQIC